MRYIPDKTLFCKTFEGLNEKEIDIDVLDVRTATEKHLMGILYLRYRRHKKNPYLSICEISERYERFFARSKDESLINRILGRLVREGWLKVRTNVRKKFYAINKVFGEIDEPECWTFACIIPYYFCNALSTAKLCMDALETAQVASQLDYLYRLLWTLKNIFSTCMNCRYSRDPEKLKKLIHDVEQALEKTSLGTMPEVVRLNTIENFMEALGIIKVTEG